MNNNMEAQDGMRMADQIARPAMEAMKILQNQLLKYFETLKEEKRPKRLEKALHSKKNEYVCSLNKEISKCAENGHPEIAKQLNRYSELIQQSIDNNIETMKGNAWIGISFNQILQNTTSELSTLNAFTTELAKDNRDMDYDRTLKKMEYIAKKSPFLDEFVIVKECNRDFYPKNTENTKIHERFKDAIKESKKIQLSNKITTHVKDELERTL